jgi:hypothetical protein
MQICTSTYQHVLHIFPLVGIFGYKLEHARMSILVHCHTTLYPLVLFWIRGGTRRYKAVKLVQWGTRQYQKVLYPWICRYKEVHEGTRPCTALYLCTGLSGTALYRLVPPRIQKRTRQYEKTPEFRKYASMYQYIRVHPSSYWLIQVIESMSWFILLRIFTFQYVIVQTKPGTYQYIPVCTWKKQNKRCAWCSDSNQGPLA